MGSPRGLYIVKDLSGGGEGGLISRSRVETIHCGWNIDIANYSKSAIMAWEISTQYNKCTASNFKAQ